jgi:hypothetical protein
MYQVWNFDDDVFYEFNVFVLTFFSGATRVIDRIFQRPITKVMFVRFECSFLNWIRYLIFYQSVVTLIA